MVRKKTTLFFIVSFLALHSVFSMEYYGSFLEGTSTYITQGRSALYVMLQNFIISIKDWALGDVGAASPYYYLEPIVYDYAVNYVDKRKQCKITSAETAAVILFLADKYPGSIVTHDNYIDFLINYIALNMPPE